MTKTETNNMLGMLFPQKGVGRFYVYLLIRPDGRPFYVGKGCGNRIIGHEAEAKRGHKCYKCNTIRKIWKNGGQVDRQIVFNTDDELVAFQCEAQLIQKFRSQLTNILDYDARIWKLIKHRQPRVRLVDRQRERFAVACQAINGLERRLRRAFLVCDYKAQEQIEEEIEAYRMWLRPPVQLSFDDFDS